MDALDILCVGTKVRSVVNLILKENPRNLVANEIIRLHSVIARVQEVLGDRTGDNRELKVSSGLKIGIADCFTPHLQAVRETSVLGTAFLVFAISRFEEALGPRMTIVPVESSRDWEVRVFGACIGGIANHRVNVVLVAGKPRRVKVTNVTCCQNKVGKVEMVVVVVGISKVYSRITSYITSCRDDATPRLCYQLVKKRRKY